MNKRFLVYGILSLLTAVHCFSQSIYFRHYDISNGLSHNAVITMVQDKFGFMWFGTPDGLNRFDGYSFKIYRSETNPTLGSNAVYYLFADNTGTLWVGTEKGLFSFDYRNETFTKLPGSKGKTIRAIENDSKGNLWFAEGNGLFCFNPQTKKIKLYTTPDIKNITSIFRSRNGTIWAGLEDGRLATFNAGSNIFELQPVQETSRAGGSIEKINEAPDGKLLIGTSTTGLLKYNPIMKTWGSFSSGKAVMQGLYVRSIISGRDGQYWIATEQGLLKYNTSDSSFIRLQKIPGDPYSISDNAVYALCRDKEGGIWAGTYFGGINYIPHASLNFQKYFPIPGQNSIAGNVIREIKADQYHNLWIGTEDRGLTKFNLRNQTYDNFINQKGGNGIASTNIHGLLADDNHLYIGTFEHGLYVMDIPSEKIIEHYQAGPAGTHLKSNYVNIIYKRNNGDIIICTANGLFKYNKKGKFFIPFKNLPDKTFFSAITEDDKNRLWIGTHSQGIFYISDQGLPVKLNITVNGNNVLETTRILNLFFDKEKKLWIGSEKGLFVADLLSGKVSVFDLHIGMPSNFILAILQDNSGNIWASTSKGLVRIDHQLNSIKVFRATDGLITEQFNNQSAYKDASGNLYFGSTKGYIKFNPSDFNIDRYIPPVFFTDFQLFNSRASTSYTTASTGRAITLAKEIVLNYYESTFSIEFSALSFTSLNNIQYAYKMEGVDKRWNNIGYEKKVHFNNLPPGNYQFKIRSTNSNGNWVDNEKAVSIIIQPPLWKTKVAYIFYLILLSVLLYTITSLFLQRQKSKQKQEMQLFALKKEKELNQMKVDFFTIVAHEIRTPLTLIKAPIEKLMKQFDQFADAKRELTVMNKNSERLLALSTQLLNFRRVESGVYHLSRTTLDIVALCHTTWQSFTPAAEQKNIDYKFETDADSILIDADEDAIIKIVSNLVDNAIKYSGKLVMMHINVGEDDPESVTIQIKNDGEIIDPLSRAKIFEPFYRSAQSAKLSGAGVGLSLARDLAKLHGGSLYYETDNEMNIFILKLPRQ